PAGTGAVRRGGGRAGQGPPAGPAGPPPGGGPRAAAQEEGGQGRGATRTPCGAGKVTRCRLSGGEIHPLTSEAPSALSPSAGRTEGRLVRRRLGPGVYQRRLGAGNAARLPEERHA